MSDWKITEGPRMTRAEAWVRFAAAMINRPYSGCGEAVEVADYLLDEYDKRFDANGGEKK